MSGFIRFSSVRNSLRIAQQAVSQGVRSSDQWIAFLLGCYGAAGHHRKRLRSWLLARLKMMENEGAITLRMRRPPMRRPIAIRLRPGNTSDYLVTAELLKESRMVPPDAPHEIIDCGANIGVFSLWSGALFPDAKIRCYEPDADNHAWLTENLSQNGLASAEIHQVGVWSHEATLNFHPAESHSGAINPDAEGIPTKCTLPPIGANCWLKLDIEGAEYVVMPALLSRGDRPQFLSMEVHQARDRGHGMLTLLEENGYTVLGNLDPSFDCWELFAFQSKTFSASPFLTLS